MPARQRNDRTVLVTGANSGLGLATVLELARRGFHTIGTVRSQAKARHVRHAAKAAGVAVDTLLLDVTDAERCAAVMADLELYGLVNNAGYGVTAAVIDTSDDEARSQLETMVVAPVRLARLAIPGMHERGGGRIVNISSILGRTTIPMTGWYQGAKHALEAVTDALRIEVAGMGVDVTLVEPGGFRTAIFDEVERDAERHAQSPYADAYRRSVRLVKLYEPLMGDPGLVARTVASVMDARFVRPRYLVGNDAQLIALTDRFTPTVVKDFVTRRFLGL